MSKANPRNIAISECAPAGARGDPATPAGVRIVVPFYPGVRFAHPRLISSHPSGVDCGPVSDPNVPGTGLIFLVIPLACLYRTWLERS